MACGDNLGASTTLHESLDCSGGDGLIIGANGVIVDLGGFVLKGDTTAGKIGVDNPGFDGVTIKNGVIQGFDQGVVGIGVARFKLDNLTFTGQTNQFTGRAVDILDSDSVKILNSSFFMPAPEFLGSEAIRLQSTNRVSVQSVDVQGGFVGVNFACDVCDGTELPTNGEVKFSTIHGAFIGVFLANTTSARVVRNHISGGVSLPDFGGIDSKGILGQVTPKQPLEIDGFTVVTNAVIDGNHVHDNDGFGIKLDGVTDSVVKNNQVHVNAEDGIALFVATDPNPDVISTGNDITDNAATGNGGFDLFHDGGSTGNTWTGNTCGTKSGGDIPAC